MFDRLLAYNSTKQSIQMSESKRPSRKDDPMDVDALSKGSGKGNPKGKGKKVKGQNHMSDCSEMWWSEDQGNGESKGKSKSKGKGKGKLNNAESSNWQEGWLEGKPQSNREGREEEEGALGESGALGEVVLWGSLGEVVLWEGGALERGVVFGGVCFCVVFVFFWVSFFLEGLCFFREG